MKTLLSTYPTLWHLIFSTVSIFVQFAFTCNSALCQKPVEVGQRTKVFDPSDRSTFPAGGFVYEGKVTDLTATTMTIISRIDSEKLTFHFVDELLTGKISDTVSDHRSFALIDVKLSDLVFVKYVKSNGVPFITEMSICEREDGHIPASRNLPWDKPGFHEFVNYKHDYYHSGKVTEYNLRRVGLKIEAIRTFGRRPGDDEYLKNAFPGEDAEKALKVRIEKIDQQIAEHIKKDKDRRPQSTTPSK